MVSFGHFALLLALWLPLVSASCTGGTFTTASAAETALAGCDFVAGDVILTFASDTTMAVQPQVEAIMGKLVIASTSSSTLRDGPCTIFPNLVAVEWLELIGENGLPELNAVCPQLVVSERMSCNGESIKTIVIANEPPQVVFYVCGLEVWEMGESFRPAEGLVTLYDSSLLYLNAAFRGASASYTGGRTDLVFEVWLQPTGTVDIFDDVTEVRGLIVHQGSGSCGRQRFGPFIDLEFITIIGTGTTTMPHTHFIIGSSLKMVSISGVKFTGPEPITISDVDSLQTLRLDIETDADVVLDHAGTDLCCDDLEHPLLRKYKGFVACTMDTCTTCADEPTHTGRNCMPCECENNSCVDVGLRRGSATICEDRTLEVSEDARPSLCFEGRSIQSDGLVSGQTLTAGRVTVSKEFVLTPTALGSCGNENDGTLVVDSATGSLVECIGRLSGWLPAGTSDGAADVLFQVGFAGRVGNVNGTKWKGSLVGSTAGFVRDRCGSSRGAWATNGGPARTNHVRLPGRTLFGLAAVGSLSWTGWIRVDAFSGADVMPVFSAGSGDAGFRVGVVGTGGSSGLVDIRVGGASVRSTTALTVGEWHHVAFVRNVGGGGLVQVFVDGVNEAVVRGAGSGSLSGLGSSDAWLGYDASSRMSDFDGAIDDVTVYGTALASSLIDVLAAQPC